MKNMTLAVSGLVLGASGFVGLLGCSLSDEDAGTVASAPAEVLAIGDVEWTPLNAARGAKSPRAATLWGNRGESVATGFLVRFVDGFSSPPHIHNVTYRGVVIRGTVHNDDPAADSMWMSTGSYWTQPAGQVHITAAKGEENLAYIEIDDGPYLVKPTDEAFDNGEKPINVDASNLVWVEFPGTPEGLGVEVAHLWSDRESPNESGMLVRLPANFEGDLETTGRAFRAVVISGRVLLRGLDGAGDTALDPGSTFANRKPSRHPLACAGESVLYVRTTGEIALR